MLIVDSKQITDGSFKLGTSNAGNQLSYQWIDETVMPNLSDDDFARKAVEKALGPDPSIQLKVAVSGLDKVTGEFKIVTLELVGAP